MDAKFKYFISFYLKVITIFSACRSCIQIYLGLSTVFFANLGAALAPPQPRISTAEVLRPVKLRL